MNTTNQILAHIAKAREAEKNVTEGPWKFSTTPQPNGCPIIGNHKGLMVAMLAHSVNEPRHKEEGLANASFIASARTDLPKCWEALEVLTKLATFIKDECHWEWFNDATGGDDRIGPAIEEALCRVNSILARP